MPVKWLLFVVCALAAVFDILWRKVPNILLLSAFAAGSFLAGSRQASGCLVYFIRAAAVFFSMYPLWKLRMFGAGDIKLCCVMAAFMGLQEFLICFLYSLIFSGAMSAVHMVRHRNFSQRFSYFLVWFRQCISSKKCFAYMTAQQVSRKNTIPFSAALFGGYLIWLWR